MDCIADFKPTTAIVGFLDNGLFMGVDFIGGIL